MNLICPPIHSFENSFNEFNRSNHTFASYDSMCINTTAPITQFVLLPFNRKIMYAVGLLHTSTLLGGALVLLLIKITTQCKISIQTFSYSSSQVTQLSLCLAVDVVQRFHINIPLSLAVQNTCPHIVSSDSLTRSHSNEIEGGGAFHSWWATIQCAPLASLSFTLNGDDTQFMR